MAEFIEKNFLCIGRTIPEDHGYFRISIYDGRLFVEGIRDDERRWIEENIQGKWTTWNFGSITENINQDGQSFAFQLEEDAFAFKLRWS